MSLSQKEILLKNKLDYHYKYFDFSKISPDPLEFPHRFSSPNDIEISAFISSIFAYGNITQIMKTLEHIHVLMGMNPYDFIMNYSFMKYRKVLGNIVHRFYNELDVQLLFYVLNKIYKNYGSLKYFFLLYDFENEKNLKNEIACFSRNILDIINKKYPITNGIKFMFPAPFKGSACKRMNLFLRWMVRKDDLDFGLWSEISPTKLVIPVDTHVAKIARQLKLTSKKTISWKMAEEITEKLKKFESKDPVKYDFAICHIGMRGMKF